MSRNIIGTFTRAEEYDKETSSVPNWLDRFAKELSANKTAVEVARERDQSANLTSQISSIITGRKAGYSTVEDVVSYYQKATGMSDYVKKAAAEKIISAGIEKIAQRVDYKKNVDTFKPEYDSKVTNKLTDDTEPVTEWDIGDGEEESPFTPIKDIIPPAPSRTIPIINKPVETPPQPSFSGYTKVPSAETLVASFSGMDNGWGVLNEVKKSINSIISALKNKVDLSNPHYAERIKILKALGYYKDGWEIRRDYVDFLSALSSVYLEAKKIMSKQYKEERKAEKPQGTVESPSSSGRSTTKKPKSSVKYPEIPSASELRKLKGGVGKLYRALNSTVSRLERSHSKLADGTRTAPITVRSLDPEAVEVLKKLGFFKEEWVDRADYLDFLKALHVNVKSAKSILGVTSARMHRMIAIAQDTQRTPLLFDDEPFTERTSMSFEDDEPLTERTSMFWEGEEEEPVTTRWTPKNWIQNLLSDFDGSEFDTEGEIAAWFHEAKQELGRKFRDQMEKLIEEAKAEEIPAGTLIEPLRMEIRETLDSLDRHRQIAILAFRKRKKSALASLKKKKKKKVVR